MAYDERLAERIRAVLERTRGAGERRMFGGVCFTVDGHMVCGVTKNDMMVRIGTEKYRRALARPHVRPMDFIGRPLAGFVYVAAAGLKGDASLRNWVGAGVAHARTLPAKSKKNARRRKTKAVKKKTRRMR